MSGEERGSGRRGRDDSPRREIAAQEEIAHHLEESAERLAAQGYSKAGARAEAERRFGNVRAVRAALDAEIRRRYRWRQLTELMAMFWNDVVQSVRSAGRARGFTGTVVATLAIGIGGALAILQIIDAVLLRPLPVADPASLVGVFQAAARTSENDGSASEVINRFNPLSYPTYVDLREQSRTVALAAAHTLSAGLHHGERTDLGTVGAVSGNYFTVLGVQAMEGRVLRLSDETDPTAESVVVLSSSLKQRLFGEANALGRTVEISGAPFTVVGTVARGFKGTSLSTAVDAWIPIQQVTAIGAGGLFSLPMVLTTRAFTWLSVVGRRNAGIPTAQVQAELNALFNAIRAESDDGLIADHITQPVTVTPIAEAVLVQGREELIRFLVLLLGIVAATFIVACSNVANLFVTRGTYRQRDFAVRRALGANRLRLASLVIVEGLVVSGLGSVIGVAVALGIARVISGFTLPGGVMVRNLDLSVSPQFLIAGFGIGVASSLLFALPPAFVSTRTTAIHMRGGRAVSLSGPFNLLVAVQLAMSLTLLAGALLFTRSVHKSLRAELGFDAEGVAAVSAGLRQHGVREEESRAVIDDVLRVLEEDPRISVAAMAVHVPLAPGRVTLPSTSEHGTKHLVRVNTVAGQFFAALRIPLLEGVYLHQADRGEESVAVVNRAAAEGLWPGQSAIGKRFQLVEGVGDFLTVVGVVATIASHDVTDEEVPYVYVSARQLPNLRFLESMSVVARGSVDAQSLIPVLNRVLQSRVPALPVFDARVVATQIDAVLMPQRFGQRLLVILGLIAAVVSAVGVYGVVAFVLSQRRRELGIRRALGARWNDLVVAVTASTIRAGVLGMSCGLFILLMAAPFVSRFLLLIGPRDPFAIIGSVLVLTCVTVVAVLPGAFRASRIDPRIALEDV